MLKKICVNIFLDMSLTYYHSNECVPEQEFHTYLSETDYKKLEGLAKKSEEYHTFCKELYFKREEPTWDT